MKLPSKIAAAIAILLLTNYVPSSLAQPSGPNAPGEAWTRFTQEYGTNWRATWDPILGAPSELRGGRYAAISGDPEQVARSFLAQNKDLFHIESDLSDLSVEDLKHSRLGAHVFFKQTYRGLPVFNGGLDIHISPTSQVFLVHNRYASKKVLASLSLAPGLSSADAAKIAEADVRTYKFFDKTGAPFTFGQGVTAASAEIGIWRASDGAYRLAYKIQAGPILYVIDAHSGKILARTQLIKFVDGTGQVFDPNPVVTLNNPNLGNDKNKNYKAIRAAYFTRTLPDITQTGTGKKATYTLVGPYVTMKDIPQATWGQCGAGDTNVGLPPPKLKKPSFLFTRNKSGFDHTMAYFHLDRDERYIQDLGFDDINDRSITADADCITADNSFYCPSPSGAGFLCFGIGGVHDAQDADVILHEYGHAIQDNENSAVFSGAGGVEETGAMGEGFGDYWAVSNNHSNNACFAAWDHNIVDYPADKGCLRRVDTLKHYPEALDAEVHDDGEIWSASLYDLLQQLGKATTDTLILESHFLLPTGAMFKDGAIALIDADSDLNAGANLNTICAVMGHRGIMSPQDLADNQCEMEAPDNTLGSYGVYDAFQATCHGTFIAANVIGDLGADLQLTVQGTQNVAGTVNVDSTAGAFGKVEVVRSPATQVGTAADLTATLTVTASAPPPPLETPPFAECPPVGADTSCQALIVIDASGNVSIDYDDSQGPFDEIEDALLGVKNESPNPVPFIQLASSIDPFAFDGDGICGTSPNTGLPYDPAPPGCPFGPTGYEGPGVSFSNIDPSGASGTVNFSPAIPPGGTAYFSLEGLAEPPSPPINYIVEVVCDGTNLAITQTANDQ